MEDMLAARRFPVIEFHSTSVQSNESGDFKVTGALTIRDRTKPVTIAAKRSSVDGSRFEGRAAIKLTDFGLEPPSAALGLVGTKDEITLVFSLAVQGK